MKKVLLTVLLGSLGLVMAAQNTVGLLSYDPSASFDGYNLFYPHNQPNVYLINNCGQLVHVWSDSSSLRPGNTAYLLPNGNLVKTKRPAAIAGNPIWAGGGGATVEIRSWDNELLWSYELNDEFRRLHHDIEPMPNGNILMIAWELKTEQEAIDAGRDPGLLPDGELWPDYILEVEPIGADDYEIVWEWHVWDHMIQDYDDTKANFGVVSDHPELIDINYDESNGVADWLHSNAIDFNQELDQIIFSVPTFNEIWVIDHSTTTQEAAGHTGGLGKRGGDLLYRWGNPAAYQSGGAAEQTLFYQHDPHWVDDFLDFTHPYFGKVAVFNNRAGSDFSTVNIFTPPFDMYDWEYPLDGSYWGPTESDWTYTHPDPEKMYSTGLSSIQLLPNGNTLIGVGRTGYAFELTPDEEIVWEYVTPLKNGNPVEQGDTTLVLNDNLTFRMKRYPADFPGFDGKELDPIGYIETNPDTSFCDLLIPTAEVLSEYQLVFAPNPAGDQVTIEWKGMPQSQFEVYDLLGRLVTSFKASGGRKYLDTSAWEQGMYFVRIDGKEVRKLMIQRP